MAVDAHLDEDAGLTRAVGHERDHRGDVGLEPCAPRRALGAHEIGAGRARAACKQLVRLLKTRLLNALERLLMRRRARRALRARRPSAMSRSRRHCETRDPDSNKCCNANLHVPCPRPQKNRRSSQPVGPHFRKIRQGVTYQQRVPVRVERVILLGLQAVENWAPARP